jgi:hypothetical protein
MADSTIPQDPREMRDTAPLCKYCEQPMSKMMLPADSSFTSPWLYICFNDECGYFVRGWKVMEAQSMSHSSYRFKTDPFTGETGPFPVWSTEAMRNLIVEENES